MPPAHAARAIAALLAAATAALLAGCTTSPEPRARAEWSDLVRDGLGDDVVFALSLTSPPMAGDRRGYLALIERDGSTRFVTTGPHSGGVVAADDGRVCATSETTTYDLMPETATTWKRGGYPGSGHWGAIVAGQGCVVVLNSGGGPRGYETDVHWGSEARRRHDVVPAIPGPTGVAGGAVWVRQAGLTAIPGELALYRTDLATGETERFMSWPTRTEPGAGGERINFDDSYASNLFEYDGRLFYLEDLLTVSAEGERQAIEPGIGSELRLGEIDPATRSYRSTFLRHSKDGLHNGDPGPGGSLATVAALRGGHLSGGVLYTADTDGNVVAVDLRTKKVRTAARLTPEAAAAADVTAAWHGDDVTLFLADGEGNLSRQTYDLLTGEVSPTQSLSGFAELLRSGLSLSGAARR